MTRPVAPASSLLGCIAEFERLAGRPPSESERNVLGFALAGRPVWVEGLRSDALVILSLCLSQAVGLRVLFISPDFELLLERQHRWGARATTHLLPEAGLLKVPSGPGTVFCSAATLANEQLQRTFETDPPHLVVVEQAHAVSSAAFEYRPSLGRIGSLSRRWQGPNLIAGAAHSPQRIRDEAFQLLGITDATLEVEHPSRLSVRVLPPTKGQDIAKLLTPLPRPALVLCSTPAEADAVYSQLLSRQLPCHRYHAALSEKERATELLQFVLPGRRAILVATSSFGPASGWAGEYEGRLREDFGRGYGRCDLRTLVHVGMPTSIEQYGQELALLKHDEQAPAHCFAVMSFSLDHIALNASLLQKKRPCPETLKAVVRELKAVARGGWLSEKTLVAKVGGMARAGQLVLRFLKDTGAIESSVEGGQMAVRAVSLASLTRAEDELNLAFQTLNEQDQLREQRLREFAQATGCRRSAFRHALGYPEEKPCGLCDHCQSSSALGAPSLETARLEREVRVRRAAAAAV